MSEKIQPRNKTRNLTQKGRAALFGALTLTSTATGHHDTPRPRPLANTVLSQKPRAEMPKPHQSTDTPVVYDAPGTESDAASFEVIFRNKPVLEKDIGRASLTLYFAMTPPLDLLHSSHSMPSSSPVHPGTSPSSHKPKHDHTRPLTSYWHGSTAYRSRITTNSEWHNVKLAYDLSKKQQWFSVGQVACLDNIWAGESNLDTHSRNPTSGAYGIPQADPGDKMASIGPNWQTNPVTQETWGIQYIDDRYGNPCSALSHEDSYGWY